MNKHLKRLILVALTLTMALSCLPVFSVFAEEEEPEASKPTFATLTIEGDATLFDVNSDIPFVVAGDGDVEEIWVIAPGETQAALIAENLTDGTHNLQFSVAGDYKAYVVSRLDEELKSKQISFHVGGTTVSTISSGASDLTCSAGSSMSFYLSCDNGACVLNVTAPSGEVTTCEPDENGFATAVFSEIGTYKVVSIASNGFGDPLSSQELEVKVIDALNINAPSSNPNPGTTTQQAPQTPDYSWVLPLAVWSVVILIIGVIILVKVLKKRKKAKPAEQ